MRSIREIRPAPDLYPFFGGWAIFSLLMLTFGFLIGPVGISSTDFRSFYTAGYQLRTEPERMYDLDRQVQLQGEFAGKWYDLPFFHPSYEALLYAPFSLLPFRAAYLCYMLFSLLLLIAIYLSARPEFCRKFPILQPWPGMMLFLFYPLMLALHKGQDSILLLLICCCAWNRVKAGQDLAAGLLLALGLFKFQLVIPIALLMALRRGRRFFAGFSVGALALLVVTVCISRAAGTRAFLVLLSRASLVHASGLGAQRAIASYPSTMADLCGLVYMMGGRYLHQSGPFPRWRLLRWSSSAGARFASGTRTMHKPLRCPSSAPSWLDITSTRMTPRLPCSQSHCSVRG